VSKQDNLLRFDESPLGTSTFGVSPEITPEELASGYAQETHYLRSMTWETWRQFQDWVDNLWRKYGKTKGVDRLTPDGKWTKI
jgi:hypothetical protein